VLDGIREWSISGDFLTRSVRLIWDAALLCLLICRQQVRLACSVKYYRIMILDRIVLNEHLHKILKMKCVVL